MIRRLATVVAISLAAIGGAVFNGNLAVATTPVCIGGWSNKPTHHCIRYASAPTTTTVALTTTTTTIPVGVDPCAVGSDVRAQVHADVMEYIIYADNSAVVAFDAGAIVTAALKRLDRLQARGDRADEETSAGSCWVQRSAS